MNMNTFYVKMKHVVNGVVYQVPVLATTLEEALEKAREYPYNTFGDFVVIHKDMIEELTQ